MGTDPVTNQFTSNLGYLHHVCQFASEMTYIHGVPSRPPKLYTFSHGKYLKNAQKVIHIRPIVFYTNSKEKYLVISGASKKKHYWKHEPL